MSALRHLASVNGHRWLLAWGVGAVGPGVASLLVPLYVVRLGGTPVDLGLLGAVAAFVGAPGAIVWGRLADRTADPRRVVLLSLVGVAALLGAMPFVRSIPVLVAANALLWLVFAAAAPVLTLLVVADVPAAEWPREIALLNAYQGYGWAGGLLLGIAWTVTVGRLVAPGVAQRALFAVCALASAFAAVLLARWMPAPPAGRIERVDPRRVARLLSAGRRNVRGATFLFTPNRLYWSTRRIHPRRLVRRFTPTLAAYYVAAGLFFTGFAAFFAPLPLYLTGAGFPPDAVFGLYLVSSLGSAAFYTRAGTLSGRVDLRALQTGALGVRGLAMPLVAIVGGTLAAGVGRTALIGGLFLLVGAAWAVVAVTAGTIVTRLAPNALRGEALGIYAALSALAGGVGSAAGGALAAARGFTVAFAAAGLVILAAAGMVGALRGIPGGTRTTGEATAPRFEAPSEASED